MLTGYTVGILDGRIKTFSDYTVGILDGRIKTFSEFAKQCMRNFGACIHMRDSDFDAPYTPRIPDDYYLTRLKDANKEMDTLAKKTDAELVKDRKKNLEEELARYRGYINEKEENLRRINNMLKAVNSYNPPTPDHIGIKNFMKEQLESTIQYDGDTTYYVKEINRIKEELNNLDPVSLRLSESKDIAKDIVYYSEEYEKELKRCEDANKWVKDFLNSLPKENQ